MPELPLEFVQTWKPIVEEHLSLFEKDGVVIQHPFNSWALIVDGFNWMNTNPIDLVDHQTILEAEGDLVITGLGLGVGIVYALHNENVQWITVIERDQRVVDAMVPLLQAKYPNFDGKVQILLEDADDFNFPYNYDFAFLDHHKKEIPEPVIARYQEHCTRVVTWWDETQKWM